MTNDAYRSYMLSALDVDPGYPAFDPGVMPWAAARTRLMSGRYEARKGRWSLDLRIDMDGDNPTGKLSGDLEEVGGDQRRYYGSFIVHRPEIAEADGVVYIWGTATQSFETRYPWVLVTIPRTPVWGQPPEATVAFFADSGRLGKQFACTYASPYFRTVEVEQDHEVGVKPFETYNTSRLPSGAPGQVMSVDSAYAEAGIQIRFGGQSNEVQSTASGTWSNAELHAAMVDKFSLWKDAPQWKMWLFHAFMHERGPNMLGIMFDTEAPQRQGCAVFYAAMQGNAPSKVRNQLYACVHEMGHAFNLMHSFQKAFAEPPMPNRPLSLSWMNYPGRYPYGREVFWNEFPWVFDQPELVHLRHGMRQSVIMGGMPFRLGAALKANGGSLPTEKDGSLISLDLRGAKLVRFGQPVVVEVKLGCVGDKAQEVPVVMGPEDGTLKFAIRKPNGEIVQHIPMLTSCNESGTVELTSKRPAVYDSYYLGYGKRGVYFDSPGNYRVVALFQLPDGTEVVSNALNIRVREPVSEADALVAELMLGDAQGQLLYLRGSDSSALQTGNDAFREVIEAHGDHPLATWASLVVATNAARPFKKVEEGRVVERPADVEDGTAGLERVIEASLPEEEGVDNITLQRTFVDLIRCRGEAGDTEGAESTYGKMMGVFQEKGLRHDILKTIETEGQKALKGE